MHSEASTIPLSPQRRCGRQSKDWRLLLYDGRWEHRSHKVGIPRQTAAEQQPHQTLQGPSRQGTGECTAKRAQSPFHRKGDVAVSQKTGGCFCMTAVGNTVHIRSEYQGRRLRSSSHIRLCKGPPGKGRGNAQRSEHNPPFTAKAMWPSVKRLAAAFV